MEKKKIDILMQNRSIVNSSYDITTVQNRMFYYTLFKAQKQKNGELSCIVNIEELKSLVNNRNQKKSSAIISEIKDIKDTSLEFARIDSNGKINCNYNLFGGYEYNENTNDVKIVFLEGLYNHIIEYSIYAPINMELLIKFRGFYTQRLYCLFRLWSRKGENITKTFTLEELRFVTATTEKYPKYSNFKEKVLLSSIKEINKIGNMKISEKFKENKKGRKVVSVELEIFDFETKNYFKNIIEPIIIEDEVVKDAYYKLSEKNINLSVNTLTNIKDTYGEDLFKRAINILVFKNSEEKVKAPKKYLTGILENLKNKEYNKSVKEKEERLGFNNFESRNYTDISRIEEIFQDRLNGEEVSDERIVKALEVD